MNIKQLHTTEKAVSANALFKSEMGNATAIQIQKGEKLKEHTTKTPAMLICVEGIAIFENEKGIKETLNPGDYVLIEAMVTHWVFAQELCELILLK